MRIGTDGTVLRPVQVEVPSELFNRLERLKARTGQSYNTIIMDWILPKLSQLPTAAEPPSEA